MDIRQRVKRRLASYKGKHWTCMLETDFKHIFYVVAKKLGLKSNDFNTIIKKASEKELEIINYGFDEYQLSKKHGW